MPSTKDGDAFFIDRSPDKFKYILEFLRTGLLPTGIVRKELCDEAAFFGVELLFVLFDQPSVVQALIR